MGGWMDGWRRARFHMEELILLILKETVSIIESTIGAAGLAHLHAANSFRRRIGSPLQVTLGIDEQPLRLRFCDPATK